MLTLFAAHIIITLSCLWTGCLFYKYIIRKQETSPAIFPIAGGLILLTLFAQLLILFIPLTINVQIVIAALLFLSALLKWKDFKTVCRVLYDEIRALPLVSKLLLLILWMMLLIISAGPTLMDDTESYHIQMIKWIQEYGTVPGIANLHERFGFNSSWFSGMALFSFLPESTGRYTALNSVLSLWLCFYILSAINRMLKYKPDLPAAIALLIVFTAMLGIWPMVRGNAPTTNYDFIAAALVIILFAETFFSLKTGSGFSLSIEWIIWPVFLFTVRIINFPLLLLSLFSLFYIIRKKKWTDGLFPVAFCLLLILPFLVRNVFISGYPFYPAPYLNFFNVDWKADPAIMEKLLNYITQFNRVSTAFMDIDQTATLPFPKWVPAWFGYLFIYDKISVLAGAAGIGWTLIRISLKKFLFSTETKFFVLILFLWFVCWFFISPGPRFIYAGLLTGIFLLVFNSFSITNVNSILKPAVSLLMILVLFAAGYYTFSKPVKQPEYRNWVFPATLPQPPVKEVVADGIILRIPEPINNNWNARCFGTALPCLYKVDPRLKARGKNISSGFRLEK